MSEVFPSVTGRNLNKETLTIPDDYGEKNLLVIVAFQQWQQGIVDDAITILEASKLDRTHLIIQIRLDMLMRAVIRDRHIRQRTVTVYIDKQAFREKLSIANDNSIHWFLIDHVSKTILLRGTDTISPENITQIISHSNKIDV